MKIVAMIPARLGSKRVKSKNLRLLDGKPLVCHVMDKAIEANVFDGIYLNSESEVFSEICQKRGIQFYKRPAQLADDNATNDDFVMDFLKNVPCEIIIQINPTSPLLTVEEIKNFVKTMIEGNFDTLHSVKREQIEGMYHGQPLNFDPLKQMPRSQDLDPIYLFSSGIMGWKVKPYLEIHKKHKAATYGADGHTGYFTLSGFSTIDIDEEEDFQLAEVAISHLKTANKHKPQYYQPLANDLRSERDVMDILLKDGVQQNELDDVNKLMVNIDEIIKNQDNSISWSKRIVNSESNSATLISQLPGEGNRLHFHDNWNEWWFIFAGEWIVECEGQTITAKKGDVIYIEKNKWHKITATGDTPAVRLAVSKDKVAHIYKEDLQVAATLGG